MTVQIQPVAAALMNRASAQCRIDRWSRRGEVRVYGQFNLCGAEDRAQQRVGGAGSDEVGYGLSCGFGPKVFKHLGVAQIIGAVEALCGATRIRGDIASSGGREHARDLAAWRPVQSPQDDGAR